MTTEPLSGPLSHGWARVFGRGLVVLAFAGVAAMVHSSRVYREDRTGRLLAHVFAARIDQELAANASPESFRAALAGEGALNVPDVVLDRAFAALQRFGGSPDGRGRERAAHRLRASPRGVEVRDRFELVRCYPSASVVITLEIRVRRGEPRLTGISAADAPPFPWTELDPDGFGLEPPLDAERQAVLAALFHHLVADLRELEELEPQLPGPGPRESIELVLADGEPVPWDGDPLRKDATAAWRITAHSLRRLDATTYRAGISLRHGSYGFTSQFVRLVRESGHWRVQARMELFVS